MTSSYTSGDCGQVQESIVESEICSVRRAKINIFPNLLHSYYLYTVIYTHYVLYIVYTDCYSFRNHNLQTRIMSRRVI